jgi:hypothetical protein
MRFAAALGMVAAAASAQAQSLAGSSLSWEAGTEASAYQDTDAVTVLTPAVRAKVSATPAGWSASGSYLTDIVSAASADIVSTASPSWRELRHAASLSVGYEPSDLGGSLSWDVSSEPDYLSLSGAARGSYGFARKNAKVAFGYSFTHDVAGRTGTPFSVYALELDRHAISGALEIVLDRATTLTTSLDAMFELGRQEKPYRYLPLFDEAIVPRVPRGAPVDLVNSLRLAPRVSERLPETRERGALSGRLAHRFRNSTLIVTDRVYADSWHLRATTLDLRWVLDLGRRVSLWPHARAHFQGGVWFWQRAYTGRVVSGVVSVPAYRTGDRELGSLYSATLGPGARLNFGASDPRDLSAIVELEGTYTRYADAIYVDDRWAGFASLQFEAHFR